MEDKNYQKGLIAGIAGGILGALAILAIVVIVGINLFVANDGRVIYGASANEVEGLVEVQPYEEQMVVNEDFVDKVNLIYAYMQDNFLYEVDDESLRNGMLAGMVSALGDPYSVYYSEEKLQSFMESSQGEYVGIGVSVSQNAKTGIITVIKPYENAPGYEAGLLPGDIIYAVGDVQVTGTELDQVVAMIKGAAGTPVDVTIVREGERDYINLQIVRRAVEIPTVEYEMLENQIGYIAVSGFDGVTADQFKHAYQDLQANEMKGLVIDLRDNGGGLLNIVEEMLDFLLPEGVIFYAKDKAGNISMKYNSDAKSALNVPLTVLVNGNSASASEVFAGNIQDFGVGTLVGTTTFGKGIMQQVYYTDRLRSTGVKLTVADYYINSDRNIHQVGIEPDVVVELDESLYQKPVIEKSEDNQLQKAVEVLMGQISE